MKRGFNIFIFLFVFISHKSFSQVTDLKNSSVNNGGDKIGNVTFSSSGTFGEAAVQTIGSASFTLKSGFQATLLANVIIPNSETQILAFSFPEETGSATINSSDHAISIEVAYGTNITGLVAGFTLSTGATVKVGGVLQSSTVTSNDFTNPVTYAVTAQNGTNTQDWIVTVTVSPNNATDILAYSIPGELSPAVINSTDHTINVAVPNGTDLSSLVASFTLSAGAAAKVGTTSQVSGTTINDYTGSVIYTVTAGDGTTTQDWVIRITAAPNNATDFLAFSIPAEIETALINTTEHTIDVIVPYGSSLTNLVATFTLSSGAQAKVGAVSQVSGTTANDFTDPITYTITAEDGITEQDWIVTVAVASNAAHHFLTFSLSEQTGTASIDTADHTISVEVDYGTDRSALVATFTLSFGATAKVGATSQVSGTTANNFNDPVIYIVTAADGITVKNWTVTVTIASPPADDEDPVITSVEMPDEFPYADEEITASVKVTDNVKVDKVRFVYRKFENGAWTSEAVESTTDTFRMSIPKTYLGAMGMLYFFTAEDPAGNADSTSITSIVFVYDEDESPEVPSLIFGETVDKYQIISIPMDLDNKNVTAVFQDLGEYDIKQWRLYHYDGSTKEYGSGFSTIETGKGYWLIVRNSKTIHVGSGSAIRPDTEGNYSVLLKPGFNQVGNPFNFSLNWDDLIEYNNNPDIGRVKLYSAGQLSEGNSIARFRGGFVYVDGTANVSIKVPSSSPPASRVTGTGIIDHLAGNPIDGKNWALPVTISNGWITNTLSAIGMSEASEISKDRLDDIMLPVPSSICSYKFYFPHEENAEHEFSRDLVPPNETYIWKAKITSVNPGEELKLSWVNTNFGRNEKTLLLEDTGNGQLINMRVRDHYNFISSGNDSIRILYGNEDELESMVIPERIFLGNPYPNPFRSEINIPFTVPDIANAAVRISIIDTKGNEVIVLLKGVLPAGYHSVTWEPAAGIKIPGDGLYLVRLEVRSGTINGSHVKRILLTH